MNIHDTRLRNLGLLIEQFGTISALSDATGVSEKYISQIMNRTKLPSGNAKNLGSNAARRIENGCRLPPGWMDVSNSPIQALVPELSAAEAELLRLFRESNKEKRRAMMALARLKTTE